MKLPPPLRAILGALAVTAAVSLIWWVVGYRIGAAMLAGADAVAFKKAFGFDEPAFLRLLFLAIAGVVTVEAGGGKWLPIAGIAFGAAILWADKTAGAIVGMLLFVLAASGIADLDGGVRHAIAAGIAALVVSIIFTLEGSYGRSEIAVISVVRAVFFFFPLLAVPEYVDRYVLKRLA